VEKAQGSFEIEASPRFANEVRLIENEQTEPIQHRICVVA